MEFLKGFTRNFGGVPKPSLQLLLNLSKIVSLKKGDNISNVGKVAKNFYIIKSGVVRSYYEDEKGKQYTRTIFTTHKTTGCLSSLISSQPCKLTYECLTDCEFYQFNFKEFKKLVKKDIYISMFYSNMLESIFLVMESRIFDLSLLNATERYLKLKKEISNIEDLFLNIT